MNTDCGFIYISHFPNDLEYVYKVGRTIGNQMDSNGIPIRSLAGGHNTHILLLVKVKLDALNRMEISIHHTLHDSGHLLQIYAVKRETYACKDSSVLINRVKSIISTRYSGDVIEYCLDGTNIHHTLCDFNIARIRKDVHSKLAIKDVDYTFFPNIPKESQAFVYMIHPINYRDNFFKIGCTDTHTIGKNGFPRIVNSYGQKDTKLLCIAVPSNVVREIIKLVENDLLDQSLCDWDKSNDTLEVGIDINETIENLSSTIKKVVDYFTETGKYNYLVDTTKKSKSGSLPSRCKHGKIHAQCKTCGGSAICIHKRLRSTCKECQGSQICEHDRQRHNCIQCKKNNSCIRQRLLARNKELKRDLQENRFKKTRFH